MQREWEHFQSTRTDPIGPDRSMKSRFRRNLRFLLIVLAGGLLAPEAAAAADNLVFFGSHSVGPDRGISVAHFDSATGALTRPELVLVTPAPAFFVLHPDGRHLYACNSNDFAKGYTGETVSAYAIEPGSGRLSLVNQQQTGGADPTYLALDSTSRHLLVANYKGGSVAVLAVRPDGSLGERTAFFQHTGSSVDPKRQTQPYAHCVRLDPANRFALVADLGVDKVLVYRFDPRDGSLAPGDPPFVKVTPGAGPRHLTFHPNGRLLYLVNEMACSIVAYAWDPARGTLAELQTISALPAAFKDANTSAEIEAHPNGRFLYATNRGHDSIAVFVIDPITGTLTLVEHEASQGRSPRNFEFDPSGRFMIVTNHRSDNAMVFGIEEASGRLTPVGQPVEVPSPFGVRLLRLP
jgi:6-phosphogluconolactonase